ncbi:uncharacterized protein LOC132196703 isoform X5 [Neocloeon triangulifer]|uniref:uncharacterized protein LOC132196703 isoform X5 n=1 Tax=Neocloeon triangulifer TaxID=2078957 RepID=UPI00286F8A5A|nr:uncharacterized protein LOC132196703 isoform X5 [Neocloeon triangulifer]
MAPKLQLLESGKIPKLLEILKDLLPDSVVAYNWLLTVARWSEQSDQVKLILMCPKVLDGTMVGLIDGVAGSNKIFGTVYAQEGKMEGLKNAMMETQLIEWQRLKHLIGIWKRFVPFLADVLREKGIDFSENYRNLNVMSVEKAAILEKEMWPENVRVGELSEKHLEKMCNLWPLFDPDLQPIILKMLQLNPSVGVFATNERGGEDLVSMVVQAELESCFKNTTMQPALQVRPAGCLTLSKICNAIFLALKDK